VTTDEAPSSLEDEGETEDERLDRNWNEMLQELRVTQTGTQILTGFLLTLPFQQRFEDLTQIQVDIYLVLVIAAGITTALGLAPVSLHRALFRKGAKEQIVRMTDYFVRATLAGVAIVLTGTVLLIFDVVLSIGVAIAVAAAVLALTLFLWIAFPAFVRPKPHR
jgi:hypothetical protein